jgi:hypothetical protein
MGISKPRLLGNRQKRKKLTLGAHNAIGNPIFHSGALRAYVYIFVLGKTSAPLNPKAHMIQ